MISDLDNQTFLPNFEKIMESQQSKKQKFKSFKRDTSLAIEHPYNCLIAVCRYLRSSEFNFVMLGDSGHGFGGAYFTIVQNVIEKVIQV